MNVEIRRVVGGGGGPWGGFGFGGLEVRYYWRVSRALFWLMHLVLKMHKRLNLLLHSQLFNPFQLLSRCRMAIHLMACDKQHKLKINKDKNKSFHQVQ